MSELTQSEPETEDFDLSAASCVTHCPESVRGDTMSVFGKNERVLVVERTEGFAVEAMLRKTAGRKLYI